MSYRIMWQERVVVSRLIYVCARDDVGSRPEPRLFVVNRRAGRHWTCANAPPRATVSDAVLRLGYRFLNRFGAALGPTIEIVVNRC